MDEEVSDFPVWKFVLFGMGVVVSISLSVTTWLFTKVIDVNERLIAIENSRCSSSDCSAIRSTLNNLEGRIQRLPSEIPPDWFREKVITNSQRIAILERESEIANLINSKKGK